MLDRFVQEILMKVLKIVFIRSLISWIFGWLILTLLFLYYYNLLVHIV